MKKLLLLLTVTLCLSFFTRLYASHVMGADLEFSCIGPNQYRVTLTGYRDCTGIDMSGPQTISVSSAQCGVTTTLTLQQVGPAVDITPICYSQTSACHGGSGVGVEKYTFQGILNLPAGCGNDWVLSWNMCCRNAAITTLSNPSSENFYIEAHLDNTVTTCDNSPVFSNDPVAVYCNNYPQFFNHGATDADGDSLYFYLMNSLNGQGSTVGYSGGHSGTNPMTTSSGTNINSATGQLSFTPSQTQIAVLKVGVDEFRNGVKIGHIERDMQIIVTNCNNSPPVAGGINGAPSNNPASYVYNTTACSNFCFTIQTSDPNAADSTYYRFLANDLPGATCTSSGGLHPTLTVCWAPTQADVGSHSFVIALHDNACPYNATASQAFTVNVAAANNPPVDAGPDTTLCPGQTTTLHASTTGSVTSYVWSDGTTTHTGQNWSVNPAVTTIYTVTANYTNGCQLTDQVVVTRDNPPAVSAFPVNSTICSNADSIQLTAFASGNVTYTWSPVAGLSCSACPNPKASPPATTTYTVVAVDAAHCPSAPFTVTVNLAPPPPVQSCSVIYATTTGTGNGSQASPASLAGAIALAQCNNALIKLGTGTYNIDNPISTISSYTTIEGGFDPVTWVKTSTAGATTIHRSALNMEGTTQDKRLVAIYMNGNSYFRFQDVTIETEDCPALAAGDNSGYSNYAVHMTNCAHYDFVRCQIKPGAATNGRNGVTPGTYNGTGGTGGAGGAGAGTGCNRNGTAGSAGGAASTGAAGGAGGARGSGSGCNTVGCGVNATSGSAGGAGTNGVAGTNAPSTAPPAPATTTTFFLSGAQAASGTDGTSGGGGGGGGGGQMGTDCTCSISGNNTGGAGGAGGQGGKGGTGGYGGGGSFGVYLVGNGTGGNFTDCDIIVNLAGTGGTAGTGTLATAGALGAPGGSTSGSCSPQSSGGAGGRGGNGGNGGNGQPGAPGVAAGIVSNGTVPTYTSHGAATAISTGINTPAIFNLPAQAAITCQNISCTNRDDQLTAAASATWNTGSGATVPTGTGTTITTQYTTVGRKDIVYNSSTYTGFVFIQLDQSTFIPVIQSSAPVLHTDTFWVCKGSTANFNIQIASADTFQWNFGGATTPNTYYGANVQNLTGLTFNMAGTFMVTARIKTSCCGWSPWDTAYILVEPNATIGYTGPTSFCAGDSVHIILSGTASSYSWAPTQGVSDPTGADVYIAPQVTTTYLATAYSPRGLCNADTAITITKQLPPTMTFTTTPAACGATGSATVFPSPSGPYTYAWNTTPVVNTATISNKPAGTYTVTVTPQGTTCSVSASTSISANGAVQAYFVKTVMPSCYGQCNGAIKVKAIGGTGPFSYHWAHSAANIDSFNNLCIGNYSVTITDANNCTSSATVTLTQPAQLIAVILDSVSPRCPGQCTGYARGDGQGGTGSYTFVWSNGYTGTRDSLLCPGTYSFSVVDANGCTATASTNIQNSLPMSIAFTTINDSCFNKCDGRLTATVTNGHSPFLYQWSNAHTGPLDSNLCVGMYRVTVTDSLGCTKTDSSAITQPTQLTTSIASQINDSCYGQCNGVLTATASGGTSGYSYIWSNAGTTGPTDAGLCIGTYSVTTTDALGCTATVSATITQPTVLTVRFTAAHNDSCSGQCNGDATALGFGGTAPYTYTWSTGSGGATATGLCAGLVSVTVHDANGCTATDDTTITEPTPLVLSLVSTQNISCYGGNDGQIVVSASGGTGPYVYGIDIPVPQPAGTFNNLTAGVHILGVYDAHGCYDTLHITLTQPPLFAADTISTTQVTCYGNTDGQIILGVIGGTYPYTYTWPGVTPANTDSIADNLPAATYTAYVTDATGCRDTVVAVITQPAQLTATATTDSISCHGGTDGKVFINTTGGTAAYVYQLDGAGPTQAADSFLNLAAGPHSVTVYDAYQCSYTVNFTIVEPPLLIATLDTARDASCHGLCDGMIRIAASGGTPDYSYSIDGLVYYQPDSFSSLCAGSYNVNVLDRKGCAVNVPATINEPILLVLAPVDSLAPRCYNGNDGTFTVIASGGTPGAGYQYSADGGTTWQAGGHFTGQYPGPVTVTVKDANGCTSTYIITVPNAPPNDRYTTVITNVTCNGGSDGSIVAHIVGGGQFGPFTYAWSFNHTANGVTDSFMNNIPAGVYTVYILDGNGCQVFGPADSVVAQPQPITATYTVTPTKCTGSSDGCINVTPAGGTGPYTHSWSNGDNTANPCNFAAGTYADTIRDANGCIHVEANIMMTEPTPVTEVLTPVSISCPGDSDGSITVVPSGGTPGYTYQWAAPLSSSAATVSGLAAGSYTVTVTDANSCSSSASAIVAPANPMVMTPKVRNVLCKPLQNGYIFVPVTGGTPAYDYIWDNGNTTNYISGLAEGSYSLTITDARGCQIDSTFGVLTDSSFIVRISPDTVTIEQGETVVLNVDFIGSGTLAHLTWDPDSYLSCSDCTTPTASPIHTTEYTVHAVSDSGCVSDATAVITVHSEHLLYVPNAFTPNNDGNNDGWEIYGNKKAWRFVEVNVFDRWGELVFQSNDINFSWDGTFKGTLMEPNVYVYVLKVSYVDGYTANNKGTVTLIR
ncbi:MAG: gliding motility-associated C-terminal domain-containing protein [Bacteroidetes bacterium]|nr:gliding motility-associated C-terminal domain-containing protein [Bacteroidota bacterium]